MTELELQRLIVKLVGDSSSYTAMMKDAVGQATSASKSMTDATSSADKFNKQLKETGSGADHARGKLSGLIHTLKEYKGELLAIVGIGGGLAMLKHSLNLASEAQSAQVDFGVMLKSAEKGKELMNQLREYSSSTHISMDSLHYTTKQLLQNNVNPENIMPITKMIGDVTGGDAQKFQHLAMGFGQMTSVGHLQGGDLMQMMNAGFNPLGQMAEDKATASGKGGDSKFIAEEMARLQKQMSDGQISVQQVTEAFKNATKEGGRFFGMVELQAKTLKGAMATLESEVNNVFREVGELISEGLHLPEVIAGISSAAKEVKQFIESMSKETKETLATLLAILAVFGGLIIALMIIKGVVVFLAGMFTMMNVGLLIIVATVALLVREAGGMEAVWKKIRQAAIDAWDWLLPIRRALSGFFDGIREQATAIWKDIKAFWVEQFKSITGDMTLDWKKLSGSIVREIVYWEFCIRNMGTVWKYVLANMLYEAIKTFNDMTKSMPDWLLAMMNPAGLIVKKTGLGDWAEKAAKELKDGLNNGVTDDFEKFLAERLKAINAPVDEVKKKLEEVPLAVGDSAAKAAKELKKLESAEWGSVEALSRVLDSQNRFMEKQLDVKGIPGKQDRERDFAVKAVNQVLDVVFPGVDGKKRKGLGLGEKMGPNDKDMAGEVKGDGISPADPYWGRNPGLPGPSGGGEGGEAKSAEAMPGRPSNAYKNSRGEWVIPPGTAPMAPVSPGENKDSLMLTAIRDILTDIKNKPVADVLIANLT